MEPSLVRPPIEQKGIAKIISAGRLAVIGHPGPLDADVFILPLVDREDDVLVGPYAGDGRRRQAVVIPHYDGEAVIRCRVNDLTVLAAARRPGADRDLGSRIGAPDRG